MASTKFMASSFSNVTLICLVEETITFSSPYFLPNSNPITMAKITPKRKYNIKDMIIGSSLLH